MSKEFQSVFAMNTFISYNQYVFLFFLALKIYWTNILTHTPVLGLTFANDRTAERHLLQNILSKLMKRLMRSDRDLFNALPAVRRF